VRRRGSTFLALLLAFVAGGVVTGATLGLASQNPSGCKENDFIMQMRQDPAAPFAAGQTINYSVRTANTDPSGAGCDASGVTVTLTTPDGVAHTLQTSETYPFPTSESQVGPTISYVVNPADAHIGPPCSAPSGCIVATATATGVVHADPAQDDPWTITKQLSGPIGAPVDTHYLCYQVKRAAIRPGTVSVVDQFGSNPTDLDELHELCNPVNKNDEDPAAVNGKPGHLDGYEAGARSNLAQGHTIRVIDQFGTHIEQLAQTTTVFVPSAKSLTGLPGPLANPGDSYVCYNVRYSGFSSIDNVKVQDEFGTLNVQLDRPSKFCDPANVNGAGGGAENHTVHLQCYVTDLPTGVNFQPPPNVWINDMFQARAVNVQAEVMELCAPATKQVIG
jgi:hypothetical protein